MTSKSTVPDAWDDEWVNQADQSGHAPEASEGKLSKAERRRRQAELNKRLWEEAEAPKTNFFVESRNPVPLQSEFKPTMKVLSRKPPPTMIAKKDAVTGLEKLTLEDDDDDEDEGESKQRPMTMEERQLKAAKEREEKQRKYEEVRERLFGSSSNPGSGSNTPGNTTPPHPRGKGKSRGGGASQNRPSPSTGGNNSRSATTKQLYDPNYSAKPESSFVQKQNNPATGTSTPTEEEMIIRQPRGPDGSGRGGFGFVPRGHARKP